MSSLIANGSAGMLLCRACRLKYSTTASAPASAWTVFDSGPRTPWRRSYAQVIKPGHHLKNLARHEPQSQSPSPASKPSSPSNLKSPRLLAKRAPGAGSEPQREPARLIFSPGDVLPPAEWASSLENLGNHDLNAMECAEAARRYVSIATQHESMWRGELEKEHHISPYLLHWMGISLLSGNSASRWRLGTHMLRSASELGYTPSTVTLVRVFRTLPAENFERAAQSKLYTAANERFRDLVKEAADPDVLTLQGITFAKLGNGKRAMDMFERATKAWETAGHQASADSLGPGAKGADAPAAVSPQVTKGVRDNNGARHTAEAGDYVLPEPREPRWAWELSCLLGQADILRSQGDARGAERLYRVAALELDNPRAFLELARLMEGPRDSPERRTYLLKAAVSGEPEACRELGKLETMAAAQNDLSDKERAELHMISKEWLRLADGAGSAVTKAGGAGDVK